MVRTKNLHESNRRSSNIMKTGIRPAYRAAMKRGTAMDQRIPMGAKIPRTRVTKEQREANARKNFQLENLQMSTPLLHCIEQIDNYMKHHLVQAEPLYLRMELRNLHTLLPPGLDKKMVPGTLQYFTRWKIQRIWLRISTLLEIISKDLNIEAFETERDFDIIRIVDPILVTREITKTSNKVRIAITNAKIMRLNKNNSRLTDENLNITQN